MTFKSKKNENDFVKNYCPWGAFLAVIILKRFSKRIPISVPVYRCAMLFLAQNYAPQWESMP